jgi:hypothetical protein
VACTLSVVVIGCASKKPASQPSVERAPEVSTQSSPPGEVGQIEGNQDHRAKLGSPIADNREEAKGSLPIVTVTAEIRNRHEQLAVDAAVKKLQEPPRGAFEYEISGVSSRQVDGRWRYSVFVELLTRNADGQLIPSYGGHCVLEFDKRGEILQVIPGA